MKFFITTTMFVGFAVALFFIGTLGNSGFIMTSVMCMILPCAMWANGFAAAKSGLHIRFEDERRSVSPVARPVAAQQQAPKGGYS